MIQKLYAKIEIYILSFGTVFTNVISDCFIELTKIDKNYHYLTGTFILMIIGSIAPLYFIFITDLDTLTNDSSPFLINKDLETYMFIFKLTVYIFLITFLAFLIKHFIQNKKKIEVVIDKIKKQNEIEQVRKKRLEELLRLLKTHTIEPTEEKKEH